MSRKGLGRILREISDEDSGAVKETIVSKINKACAEGITENGHFSMLKIIRQLKDMLEEIESEHYNRDKFFQSFNKLYSLVMAPDRRAIGVFHPSQLLDGCCRSMTYDLMNIEPTDLRKRGIGAELQRTFDVGTWYHIYIQNILYSIGLLEQAEVPIVNKKKFLNGKADGVFKEEVFGEKVVLEIKTMNSWSYQKAVFKPFKKHEFQASLYARELGAKKVLYLYINKDTSEIKDFLLPINAEQLKIADEKMQKVIDCVEKGEIPSRTCTDKFCDRALDCPFVTKCFES